MVRALVLAPALAVGGVVMLCMTFLPEDSILGTSVTILAVLGCFGFWELIIRGKIGSTWVNDDDASRDVDPNAD